MIQSQLGFGTSGIMGSAWSDQGRLKLLDRALDQRIEHFDTAPIYGQGDAETLIGRFACGKRDRIRIATKFGLTPKVYPKYLLPFKPAVRVINSKLKPLTVYLNRETVSNKQPNGKQAESPRTTQAPIALTPYNPQSIAGSLHQSLRKLRTDYVDYFFLHDCHPARVNDEVVKQLEAAKDAGKVRYLGLATSRQHASSLVARYPQLGEVIQVRGTRLSEPSDPLRGENRLLITHSLFQHEFKTLLHTLSDIQPNLSKVFGNSKFAQMPTIELITRFIMFNAARKNDRGILLFSSSSENRIIGNASANRDVEINRELDELIRSEILENSPSNR